MDGIPRGAQIVAKCRIDNVAMVSDTNRATRRRGPLSRQILPGQPVSLRRASGGSSNRPAAQTFCAEVLHSRPLSRFDAYVSILRRGELQVAVRSLRLTYALGAGEFGTLDPVHAVGEVLVKIDRLTAGERRAVREALRVLTTVCGRRVEAALAKALLMARIEEEARDLCSEFVRDARSQHGLTWSQIGAAFGIAMQSAQWRFSRPPRRLRRACLGELLDSDVPRGWFVAGVWST
jgi:hypothetical protein